MNEKKCVLVIPSMHPGRPSYGNSKEASRLFMIAAIVWLATTEALRFSDSRDSKRTICEGILGKVEAKTGPDTDFGRAFNLAKQKFSAALTSIPRAPSAAVQNARAKRMQLLKSYQSAQER